MFWYMRAYLIATSSSVRRELSIRRASFQSYVTFAEFLGGMTVSPSRDLADTEKLRAAAAAVVFDVAAEVEATARANEVRRAMI
jgi:hypothetical protein